MLAVLPPDTHTMSADATRSAGCSGIPKSVTWNGSQAERQEPLVERDDAGRFVAGRSRQKADARPRLVRELEQEPVEVATAAAGENAPCHPPYLSRRAR